MLQPEHRYSDWLKENHGRLASEQTKETRVGSWPEQWDKESSAKYWRGMTTGNWHNAEAERRAAMAEGTLSTGGYLVPSPVAGEYVDMLRDQVVVMQGMSHTIPWNQPGNTMAIPVTVTDAQIQNLAEATGDLYPPASDVTVNRYLLTARPYASVETWSFELEEDSQLSIPDIVSRSFAQRMARSVQADFFYGSGATFIQGISTAAGLLSGFEGGASPPTLPTAAAGKAWTYVDAAITATRTAKSDTDMIVTSPLCFSKYGQLQNTLFDALRPTRTVQSYIDGNGGSTGKGAFYQTTAIKDNITVGADVTDVSDMYFL
jgi:HK97 family phage major capsid protein